MQKPFVPFLLKPPLFLSAFLEELQKQLLEQVELRKKLEREFQNLKGKINSATVLFPLIWLLSLAHSSNFIERPKSLSGAC